MMTHDEALSRMIRKPAQPWSDAAAWYATKMSDFDLFVRRIANYRLPSGFTTHDIAHRAGLIQPAQELDRLARLIWGERWQSALASTLNLNLRTVQRWAAGQGEPPPGIIDDLREIGRRRITEIKAALRE